MTDDDPMTSGEIKRAFARQEAENRAQIGRITSLAAEMLPLKLYEAERAALLDRFIQHEKTAEADRLRSEEAIKDLRGQIKDLREEQEKRSDVTWQKILGLIVALATIAGVFVTLIGQTKGIK